MKSRTNITAGFREPEEHSDPTHTHETLASWLDVYSRDGCMVFTCDTCEQIEAVLDVYPDARPIGKNHSYNRSAINDVAIRLGGGFNYVKFADENKYIVGGSASISDVMQKAMVNSERLINSGNHREQTFVGACLGGTHGFGDQATMIDMVVDKRMVGPVCVEMVIKTVEKTPFKITHCVCPLSQIAGKQSTKARSYAIFPFSGDDPLCVVSEYEPSSTGQTFKNETVSDEPLFSWWRLSVIRSIQKYQRKASWLHRMAQKVLNLAKMKTWVTFTDPDDIDAMYHPWPEADKGGREGNVIYHSQRPTYQYHNLAFACKPEDTEAVIQFVKKTADKKLAGFIGGRELTTKSEYEKALNFDGPRNAIDVYFYKTKRAAEQAEKLQAALEETDFDLRWHPSKSI